MRRARRLYYLSFCAAGIFSAEAVCGNEPWGPLNPLLYLAYGLLYIFFLDLLARRRVTSWVTAYLLGVLVGYVTESFAAKVMWFGWADNGCNPGGILPWPELPFLAFFYHPVFSFLLPLYLACHHAGYPLALRRLPAVERLVWFWPLFPGMAVAGARHPPLIWIASLVADAIFILLLLRRLKSAGPLDDVRLTPAGRRRVLRWFVVSCVVFFLFLPPHGRSAVMLPSLSQVLFAAMFIALVALLVRRRTSGPGDEAPVPFDPGAIDTDAIGRYLAYFVGMAALGVAVGLALPALSKTAFILFVSGGILVGTAFFARSVWCTVRGRSNQEVEL